MKLPVLFVHGIGGSSESWAEPHIRKLREKTLSELRQLLKDKAPRDAAEALVVRSVYWKGALEKPQNQLRGALATYFGWVVSALTWQERIFRNVVKKLHAFQSVIVPMFIGDIVGYLGKEGRIGVEERFAAALEALLEETGEDDAPMTFVAHSLGTVITSNYIYDRMSAHWKDGVNRMDARFVFANLFTAGSPLALFSMRFGGPENFNRPVRVEHPRGRWVNILDKDDPVSMPLRVLNAAYETAVTADCQVDSGWNWGQAHVEYFERTDTLDIVAKKLAIDWAALNGALPPAELDALYAAYDKAVLSKELSR